MDLEEGELVVRREPTVDGYADLRRFGPGEAVTSLVATPPVDVSSLLGR